MAKALPLNEICRRGVNFAIERRDSLGDEKQDGQSFVRDLLQVFSITATKAALYEYRARRGLLHEQVSHVLWRWKALQGRMCTMSAPYPQEFLAWRKV